MQVTDGMNDVKEFLEEGDLATPEIREAMGYRKVKVAGIVTAIYGRGHHRITIDSENRVHFAYTSSIALTDQTRL